MDGRTVNRKVLEALIKCGACDCLGQTRATLFAQIDRTLARAASIIADRQRGQSSLFGALEENARRRCRKPISSLPEWPQHELLAHEKELLGFYVTGHPLTPYAPILEKYALANTATLAQLPNRSLTRIGGLIAAVQNGVSKKSGKPYSLVTLEDLEGSVQVLCMNENYDKYRELLVPNKAILVIGEVNTGDDKPKIFPQEIMPLEDAPRRFTKQVHLRLHTAHLKPEHLESVRELVAAHPGKCPLFLCFVRPTGEVIFVETHEQFCVAPSRELQQAADDSVRRGDLLREGGHLACRTRAPPLGTQTRIRRGAWLILPTGTPKPPSHEPENRSRRCETAEINPGEGVRQFTLAATRVHGFHGRPISSGFEASMNRTFNAQHSTSNRTISEVAGGFQTPDFAPEPVASKKTGLISQGMTEKPGEFSN